MRVMSCRNGTSTGRQAFPVGSRRQEAGRTSGSDSTGQDRTGPDWTRGAAEESQHRSSPPASGAVRSSRSNYGQDLTEQTRPTLNVASQRREISSRPLAALRCAHDRNQYSPSTLSCLRTARCAETLYSQKNKTSKQEGKKTRGKQFCTHHTHTAR